MFTKFFWKTHSGKRLPSFTMNSGKGGQGNVQMVSIQNMGSSGNRAPDQVTVDVDGSDGAPRPAPAIFRTLPSTLPCSTMAAIRATLSKMSWSILEAPVCRGRTFRIPICWRQPYSLIRPIPTLCLSIYCIQCNGCRLGHYG